MSINSKTINIDVNKTIFFVDGNAYIHRAYHAIPLLTTTSGLPTNAVFGFVRMILKIIKTFNPKYLGICFDSSKPTFRHKIFSDYKATRKKLDDELKIQIPIVHEFVNILNIKHITIDSYEADDVISSLAKKFSSEGYKIIIISGDKDILQIVDKNIIVYNEHKDVWYDEIQVKQRYGVPPSLLVDYFSLLGDKSDNIVGVYGIGEKTAQRIVSEFGDLDNIYANLDKLDSKTKEKLINGKENAYRSKQLIVLCSDIKELQQCNIEDFKLRNYSKQELIEFLNKYEMKSIIAEITKDKSHIKKFVDKDVLQLGLDFSYKPTISKVDIYETDLSIKENSMLITTTRKFHELISKMSTYEEMSFSLVTSDKNKILGIAGILIKKTSSQKDNVLENGLRFYIPLVQHKSLENKQITILEKSEFVQFINLLLKNDKLKLVSYNFKYQLKILYDMLPQIINLSAAQLFDICIGDYLLDPDRKDYTLNSIVNRYLKQEFVAEIVFPEDIDISIFPIEKFMFRILTTIEKIYLAWQQIEHELNQKGLMQLYTEIESKLITVIARMEHTGIMVDLQYLKTLKEEIEQKISLLKRKIFDIAGLEINLNSPKQLSFLLFEKLGLPKIKKKKTGYSTEEEVLHTLYNLHPIIPLLLEYREAGKLKNTYIDPITQHINPVDNRVHTTYNLTGTSTGRLSSENPNLQNIPVKTELGKKIRNMFIAEDGYKLVSFDYSQIELRILAHFSKDKNLISAFMENKDIHTMTAIEVLNLKSQNNEVTVTSDIRRIGKTINFGIIYGITAAMLAKELGVDSTTAQEYIDKYFTTYSQVKQWIEQTINFARTNRFVRTMFNRIRLVPMILSDNKALKHYAERIAVNTTIQGTAADIIKLAMIKIDNLISKEYNYTDVRLLLQIHDELIFEIKNEIIEEVVPKIKNIMQTVVPLEVPLVVDVTVMTRWAEG